MNSLIEFVTASHSEDVLQKNLLTSAIFKRVPLIVKRNYENVGRAYNEAETKAPIVAYVHHDVFLPDNFEERLHAAIFSVSAKDPNWGIIGAAGVHPQLGKKKEYGYILDRGKEWGSPNNLPQEVQTLDELILIVKGKVKFDEQFEQDFYGADLCIQLAAQGRKSYAANLFCHHNSIRKVGGRTESFYESEKKFFEKWKQRPLVTTCAAQFMTYV